MGSPDELQPPERLLMGPGPSETHVSVLRAFGTAPIGHLDPEFLSIMDETQELLRTVFRTDNKWTIPVSGTGSAAMEAAFTNLIQPDEIAVVPGNGYFGNRMAAMVSRAGGTAVQLEEPWGTALEPELVREACAEYDPAVVGIVHAETSTGVLQSDLKEIASIVHEYDALLVVDCVTSLGGVPFRMDAWDIDVAYAAAQKCISCPPGASPLSLSDRAMEKVHTRRSDVRSWYLDLSLLEEYWGAERAYHHTAPVNNVYALRAALQRIHDEGLSERWQRHSRHSEALQAGLWALDLEPIVPERDRLPTLITARLPDHVTPISLVETMRESYNIEIATGLGAFASEAIRIGCMGYGARRGPILETVSALEGALIDHGVDINPGIGVAAVNRSLK